MRGIRAKQALYAILVAACLITILASLFWLYQFSQILFDPFLGQGTPNWPGIVLVILTVTIPGILLPGFLGLWALRRSRAGSRRR